MPGQKIGERIREWFRSWPYVGKIADWVIDWQDRRQAQRNALNAAIQAAIAEGDWGQVAGLIIAQIPMTLLGDIPPISDLAARLTFGGASEVEAFKNDPQGYLERKLEEQFSSPTVRAVAEFVGTIITEPVLTLLEGYAADPNPDPHAMSRSFHGIASGLPWAAEMLDSVLKLALGKRAPQPGRFITALYWGLGLGFLGWQTLAPLLSSGLQPNLERYYNKLYRPARFNASQMSDLYALGERSAAQMQDYLRELGWRDEDIASWLKLSYRRLSESAAWDLYQKGQFTKDQMDARLREAGFDPAEIPLLYKVNEKEDTSEARNFTISTAKSALKAGLIGVDEFRKILTELKYQPREIELQVQLLTAQQEQDAKDLSTSQIRSLYDNRIIGRDEAIHYLVVLRYSQDVSEKLISAWDNEALPKPARINKSTILEAYTDGVLSRQETLQMLQSESGYSATQAEFLVKVEEATAPAPVETPEVAAASLSMLADFVAAGLITRAELADRAEIKRFRPEDQARIIELMFQQPPPPTISAELSGSLLASAYIHGVIDRSTFATRLVAQGLSEVDAEIAIRTLELENPLVFGEFRAFYLAQPSLGSMQLALQRGLLDEAGFRQRLEAQGYSQDAIEINLFNAQYQAPAKPKEFTKTDIMSLYRKMVITRAEAQRRLLAIGYTTVDVDLLIKAEALALEDTQISDFYLAGFIDATGFVALATEAGFTPAEIEDYFIRVETGEIA